MSLLEQPNQVALISAKDQALMGDIQNQSALGYNGVVTDASLGLPGGHVRCSAPGSRQPYMDIATET
jgi:hypothetical protein